MLVPRFVGEKLGWWDEDYFFYGEDLDFCFRIKKAGYKIYFVPTFRALHLKGISSGIKKVSKEKTHASSATKKLATFHRFHAMEIFYDKHYKDKYPKIVNFLVLNGINFRRKIAEFNL
jgi:GT2 family glycosyltransferase